MGLSASYRPTLYDDVTRGENAISDFEPRHDTVIRRHLVSPNRYRSASGRSLMFSTVLSIGGRCARRVVRRGKRLPIICENWLLGWVQFGQRRCMPIEQMSVIRMKYLSPSAILLTFWIIRQSGGLWGRIVMGWLALLLQIIYGLLLRVCSVSVPRNENENKDSSGSCQIE